MKDQFEHIHHATNNRLAEMLEDPIPVSKAEWNEIISEAARRLRIPPHITFNHEYFDL